MFRELLEKLKESRLFLMGALFVVLSCILICRLFSLQIIHGKEYAEDYRLSIEKIKNIPATRGKIYDTNGVLLAYNDLAYTVKMEDVFESSTNRNKELNENIFKLIGEDWMLITAGNKTSANTMTASFGGFGILFSKKVAAIFVRPITAATSFAPPISCNSSVSIKLVIEKQTAKVPTTFSFAIKPVTAAAANCQERTPTTGKSINAKGFATVAKIETSAV